MLFTVLGLLFSHSLCITVAYNYAAMLCAIEHCGASAPADVVFLLAIPQGIAVGICAALALYCKKKRK